eukprot:4474839-Pleurochrysis_carterae.AAC.1
MAAVTKATLHTSETRGQAATGSGGAGAAFAAGECASTAGARPSEWSFSGARVAGGASFSRSFTLAAASSVCGEALGTHEAFAAETFTVAGPTSSSRPSSHLVVCASLHLRISSFGSRTLDSVSEASSSRAFPSPM